MYVASSGMVCSVGLSAESACAAIRAGIANFDELPYRDNQGEPIVGAVVPGLDPRLDRRRRLLAMSSAAVADCLDGQSPISSAGIPLFLCLAEEQRPGGGAAMASQIIDGVQAELQIDFHPTLSRAVTRGHASAFAALGMIRQLLSRPEIPACLLCGVDSYINASSLLWLDENSRLKTALNHHGLIPGEAAAAVLLKKTPETASAVQVIGLGFDLEKSHVLSEEPLLGLGLSSAARNALAEAEVGLHEIDWRVSDLSGEQYGFKELTLVASRLIRVVRQESQPLWHGAQSLGEIGAAAGVAQLIMVERAFRQGYACGEKVICLTSSVSGDRAAAVLQGQASQAR